MTFENTENYFWQSSKIRLRPMRSDDWELRHQESTDSEGFRLMNYTVELPKSSEMDQEWIEEGVNFKRKDNYLEFSIETLSGQLVGGINIWGRDQKNGTFSFGLRIYRPYRRKGHAEDAVMILLRYAFHELRFQKCNSGCIETNEASIALHKKLGFKEEGVRRRTIYTNGKYHGEILFGLTREEFDSSVGDQSE